MVVKAKLNVQGNLRAPQQAQEAVFIQILRLYYITLGFCGCTWSPRQD